MCVIILLQTLSSDIYKSFAQDSLPSIISCGRKGRTCCLPPVAQEFRKIYPCSMAPTSDRMAHHQATTTILCHYTSAIQAAASSLANSSGVSMPS